MNVAQNCTKVSFKLVNITTVEDEQAALLFNVHGQCTVQALYVHKCDTEHII